MKKIIGALVVVVLLVGVFFVSKKDSDTAMDMPMASSTEKADTSQATATNTVNISNFKYAPGTINVKKGTKVTWTNTDSVAHTVTADTMPGPDSELLASNETYSYTYDKAGTYTYYCKPHTYMKATVIVTD